MLDERYDVIKVVGRNARQGTHAAQQLTTVPITMGVQVETIQDGNGM